MWKPINYRLVVKVEEVKKETKSGVIVVVDEKMEKNAATIGTIVSIGEDAFIAYKTKTPFAGLKVGDQIAFAKYAGVFLKNPDGSKEVDEIMALNDSDIIAVWDDTDNVASKAP